MKKNYLLIISLTAILVAAGMWCYWLGGNEAISTTEASSGKLPIPFSLGGTGLLLAIVKWFINKVIVVISTCFKLIIAFMLLMAAGMGVMYLF